MRRYGITCGALMMIAILSGCQGADEWERKQVNEQQALYNKNQPIPRYDWSLSRHLWVQFYDAQNREVTTFSYITPLNGGAPMFECASLGYALPRDTQLTNPHQIAWAGGASGNYGVIDQAEPNGLFTGPNSDATIIFAMNKNGTVSPVYTELKVTAFPFPVKWVRDTDYPQGHWVRVGESSNVELSTSKH